MQRRKWLSIYHSSHQLVDQKTHEQDLSGLRFEFLQLPKFEKKLDEITTMVEKWCYYFKYAPETTAEDLEKLVGSDEVIKEAYEALNTVYWTDNELMLYEQEMKSENDALSMLRQAELEGRRDEKLLIAKNFLRAGVAASIIAQSTGLTGDEIKALRDSN